jgi:hypothetical protein
VTDLFVFGRTAPVPPSCRRERRPLPPLTPAGRDTAEIEFPPLAARAPVTRILPSLCVLSEQEYSFRFEGRVGDGPWVALSPVGPYVFEETGGKDDGLIPDIDVFTASPAAAEIHLRVRIQAPDLAALGRAPMLASASLSGEPGPDDQEASGHIELDVPALSQMEAPEAIRRRICSPTCVAMVLGYWKHPIDPAALAAEIFDARNDLYGIWPAAIRAAARRGLLGYLLRFPSWADAAWCLGRGLPIIASVRYDAGELAGAAIEGSKGHLLVLTGYDGDRVRVNDPAAPTARDVPRHYALTDLRRVWIERTGVGYVLFDRMEV